MPLATNATYDAANAIQGRVPVYVLELGGDVAFSTHAIDEDILPYLQDVIIGRSQVNPRAGRSSIGGFSVRIEDVGQSATALFLSGFGGRSAQLYGGFIGTDWPGDYVLLSSGAVQRVVSSAGWGGYEINVADTRQQENRTVFRTLQTRLADPIDDSQATLDITSLGGWPTSGYVVIDQEVIGFSGRTGATLTGLERGALGSAAAEHGADSVVNEMIRLQGHPIDIAVDVLTGTGRAGLGIPVEQIDTDAFDAAKAAVGDVEFDFRILSSENGKAWLEREIFAPLAAYPITTNAGLASIKIFRQPLFSEVAAQLTERTDILLTGFDENLADLVNAVSFKLDYDPVRQSFLATTAPAEAVGSIDQFGRSETIIESRGLRSGATGTDDFIFRSGREILRRFRAGAAKINGTATLPWHTLEAGDIIAITSDVLPNRFTGERGVTQFLVEITQRSVQFERGRVELEMIATGFRSVVGLIAPTGTADWPDVTDDAVKQTYGFVTDSDGLQSDGVQGKRIS